VTAERPPPRAMLLAFESAVTALETVPPMPQCAHSPERLCWHVVRILQRENETLQTRIARARVVGVPLFQLQRCKSAEDVPVRVFNESESVHVAIAQAAKVARALPQKRELFPAESPK
jgi:hypothetical protein